MANPRQISQRINELLGAQGDAIDSAELAQIAPSYAELTRRTHDRLGRCHDLLARGLRSEAVQESDIEPSLLNMVAALEIDDFQAWDNVCRKHGLPQPSPLSRHVASELNRAYAADQLVAPLLREYRFRCLSRRPLTERIAALRGIAGLDKNNSVWNESLVALETHRLGEVRHEIERSLGNADELLAIQRELLDDRRRVSAPDKLVRRVDEGLRTTLVKQAQEELRTLLPALHEAYSAMDYRAAKGLLESWDATLKSVGQSHLHLPEDLREPVQPIMDWVQSTAQQHERDIAFRRECTRLQGLIDHSDSIEDLARAYSRVTGYDLPLPDTLGEDYRRARQRLELRTARRRRNRLAAAAGIVLLAGVSVGWTINSRLADRRITQTLAEVERDISQVNLSAAADRFAGLSADHPDATRRDDVQQIKLSLDQAIAREEERRANFVALDLLLSQAADSPLNAVDIQTLESLSLTDEEKAQASDWRNLLNNQQLTQQQQRETQMLARANSLRDKLSQIDSTQIDDDPDAVLIALSQARGEIVQLRSGPDVSTTTAALIESASRQEDELRRAAVFVVDQRVARAKQVASLDQVIASSSSAETLASALRRYSRDHADDFGRAKTFARAAQDAQAWRSIEAWQKLVSAVDHGQTPEDLADVARRIRELDAYLESFPRSPVRDAVKAYRNKWAGALLVSSDSGPWLGRLPEILRAPVIRDLNSLQTNDEKRFYVVGQGNSRETSLGTIIDVVLTPDITQSKTISLRPGTAGKITASPQSLLAVALLAQIADYRLGDWDTFHVDLIETVLTHTGVDTVLQGVLITMVIDEAQKTLGEIDPELQRFRKLLNAQNEDGLNWLDPNDLTAGTVREHLDTVIAERLPDFVAMRRRINANAKAVDEHFGQSVQGRGVLLREGGMVRVAGMPDIASEDVTALLAVAPGAEAPYEFLPLGHTEDGTLRLRPDQAVGVPEGTMVFLLPHDSAQGFAR